MSEADQDFYDIQDNGFEPEEMPVDHGAYSADDPVLLYLREIGDIEILTAEDEFRLAVLIQAGKAADRLLEADPDEAGALNYTDFTELWNRYLALLAEYNKGNPEPVSAADLLCLLEEAEAISPKESEGAPFLLYTFMNPAGLDQKQQKELDKTWKKVYQPLFDSFIDLCLMPPELIDSLEGVEAYWILNDGSVSFTDGLAGRLSSQGAVNRP